MTSPYARDRAADIGAARAPGEPGPTQSAPDRAAAGAGPAASSAAARGPLDGGPVLPEQSPEDTDAAWGEYPESRDDRLYRDRPPHWDDF
jgi:hypothetical protein